MGGLYEGVLVSAYRAWATPDPVESSEGNGKWSERDLCVEDQAIRLVSVTPVSPMQAESNMSRTWR